MRKSCEKREGKRTNATESDQTSLMINIEEKIMKNNTILSLKKKT